jgi:prepilin-type N-terminal cleavage/methylation domain-containing protein/prepilin-type processing-associated H-X9-DG protein
MYIQRNKPNFVDDRLLMKAFTLIELLVVIAIISLLVSILLPSLQNAKLLARKAACMSNLKNCGTMLNLYASENSSMVPPGLRGYGYMPSVFTKPDQDFRSYFENAGYEEIFDIMLCPGCDVVPINDPANTAVACYMSYFYFPNRLWPNFGTPDAVPTKIEDLAERRWVIMQDQCLLDQFGTYLFNHPERGDVWLDEEDTRPSTGWWYGDEGRGANLLFADGSVAAYEFDDLEHVGDTNWGSVNYYSRLPK